MKERTLTKGAKSLKSLKLVANNFSFKLFIKNLKPLSFKDFSLLTKTWLALSAFKIFLFFVFGEDFSLDARESAGAPTAGSAVATN